MRLVTSQNLDLLVSLRLDYIPHIVIRVFSSYHIYSLTIYFFTSVYTKARIK
jgi:hypothetical protein